MEPEMAALEPEALDALLRAELGRPLVVVGLTLAAGAATGAGLDTPLGEPPAGPIAGLARYGELWVRWLAAGTRLADALGRAAVLDADALLIWVPASESAESGADTDPEAEADVEASASRDSEPGAGRTAPLAVPLLRAVMGAADADGLHDRAVMLLVGPGASRGLARALGYDDGFGADAPVALVATAAADGALASARLRGGGSSPPCYL
jgi:hypothetical protein